MTHVLSQLFPFLYAACFLVLLWKAFKVMGQGFRAFSGTGETRSAAVADGSDRTGRLTIHPELLDAEGQITQDDLLTVHFSGGSEPSSLPRDPA